MKKKPLTIASKPSELSNTAKLGVSLEKLGKALQNDDSPINDLLILAAEAGLKLEISFDKKSAKIVSLRDECDRLIIAEKELRDANSELAYELALVKSLTGIVSASWETEGKHRRLNVSFVSGAPYGPSSHPIKTDY